MAITTSTPTSGSGARVRVQKFGTFLSNMVMPNIGAFIAWGFITALFIPAGWINLGGGERAWLADDSWVAEIGGWGAYDDGTGGIAACAVGRTTGTSCGTTRAGAFSSPAPPTPTCGAPGGNAPISAPGLAIAGALPRLTTSAVRAARKKRNQRDIVVRSDAGGAPAGSG